MRPRLAVGCALVLAAASPGFAQDWFEPNPSRARLSADDAYARESAKSLRTAGFGAGAIRLDDAGRVLVAGGLRVARLDADGRLDPTFGIAGVAELPGQGFISGLEIDAAGRIVVIGYFYEPASDGAGVPASTVSYYLAARLLADGSLDPSFSGDGLLEFDAANYVDPYAVHAAGSDGAMLVVVTKVQYPQSSSNPWPVGLVRITADGALDATYGDGALDATHGDGFAQIVRGAYPGESPSFVADFAVDSAGRAVVAAQRDSHNGGPFVLRLDAAGSPDPTFFGYTGSTVWDSFAASQVALDGAGRIVGLDDTRFLRRLTDGAPDPAFSGDGFAWNQAAHVVGLTSAEQAQLCATERMAPNFEGVGRCEGRFLAVATQADRWATAKAVAHRIEVRAIDPTDPGAIVSTTYRPPDRNLGTVAGLVISPDGSTAYALGGAFVLRVDLAKRKALTLPDLRVKWLGWPHAVDFGGGRYRVTARVRIRNAARHDAESVMGLVRFGDGAFDVALAPFPTATNSKPFRVRARSSVVKRFTWEGGDIKTDLAGVRLGIQVSCELPDANFADNTATSRTISPLYAPR